MRKTVFLTLLFALVAVTSCANIGGTQPNNATADNGAASTPASKSQPTPGKSFTTADVAKLKWIEGTWKGMDGDKPFYEWYRFEGDSVLIVDSSDSPALASVTDSSRYELKDGEFGKTKGERHTAASEILADAVQFVPVGPGGGNAFRWQRESADQWKAILEWPASSGKPAGQKVYTMTRFEVKK